MAEQDQRTPMWFVRYRVGMLTAAAILFAVAVAAVTGRASWGHIVDVAREVKEPSAAWLPVAVDGMMLACTALCAVDVLRGYKPRFWAVFGMWLGAAMTLAFNVASAYTRGPIAMIIAAVYAVATLITVEALFHPSKRYLAAVREDRAKAREAALPVDVVTTVPALVVATTAPVPAPVVEPAAPVEPDPTPVVEPEETVTAEEPAQPAVRVRKPRSRGRASVPYTDSPPAAVTFSEGSQPDVAMMV
jgi:hypothetical protein